MGTMSRVGMPELLWRLLAEGRGFLALSGTVQRCAGLQGML